MKTTTIQYIYDVLKERYDTLEAEFNDLREKMREFTGVAPKMLEEMDPIALAQFTEKCETTRNIFITKRREFEEAEDAYHDFCNHQW